MILLNVILMLLSCTGDNPAWTQQNLKKTWADTNNSSRLWLLQKETAEDASEASNGGDAQCLAVVSPLTLLPLVFIGVTELVSAFTRWNVRVWRVFMNTFQQVLSYRLTCQSFTVKPAACRSDTNIAGRACPVHKKPRPLPPSGTPDELRVLASFSNSPSCRRRCCVS